METTMRQPAGRTPANGGPKRTLSIRVRLMILAVIALLPVLVERIHNEEFDRRDRIEAAYKHALDLAKQGAAFQNDAIISARAILNAIAGARTAFRASDAKCNAFLADVVKSAPWVRILSVANLQGRIICSSYPDAIGFDISKRPQFNQPIEARDFYLSDYFVGDRYKAPLITLALAERNADGAPTAVILSLLDLTWFETGAKAFVPESGSMLMIDSGGTILARYPDTGDFVGQRREGHPLIQAMLTKPDGFVTTTGFDGVRRIYGYMRLPGTDAHIAVGLDELKILAHANNEMWIALIELAVVALFVLVCIWFGGERLLVRPIRSLTQSAVRIGDGELRTRADALPWVAEFVPLATAMADMADRLDAREQELRETNAQLRELAQIDALTGLANRRAFNERLMSEWRLACKLRQPIAVLMIDVDFFKPFNDQYGHIQGDNCLRKVAGVLKASARSRGNIAAVEPQVDLPPSFQRAVGRVLRADFAARYGGEEFTVLLQGADLDTAMHAAERLRQGVEDLLMAHSAAPWGYVSVSIGAAALVPTDRDNPQTLTESADAALYQAKAQGRNRVACDAPVPLSHAG